VKSQEYLQPLSGSSTKGGNFIDVTARNIKTGQILRINTIDTLADGQTPTLREALAAALIQQKKPDDLLILVPKSLVSGK
jgi:hypothetical protein